MRLWVNSYVHDCPVSGGHISLSRFKVGVDIVTCMWVVVFPRVTSELG